MKSDRGFLAFFASDGQARKVGVLVIVGAILLLIGSGSFLSGENKVAEEDRAAEMCSMIRGVGECRVMMTYHPDDEERVFAVLILCEGAESPAVRESVTSLFCSLYGIGSHRVEIQPLENK